MVSRLRPLAGYLVREDLRLLPKRRHQPIDLAAMLRAFADHVDAHVVHRAHVVVDHDRASDGKSGANADLDIWLDAGGNHDHVAFEDRPVLERETGDAGAVAQHGCRRLLEMDLDAHRFDGLAKDRPAGRVDLHIHQVRAEVHDMHFAAVVDEAACRLQAEQPSPDHDRFLGRLRPIHDRVAVVDRAKTERAVAQRPVRSHQPLDRWNERPTPGGDQQFVIGHAPARGGHMDVFRGAIDLVDVFAGIQFYVVLLIPVERVEIDVVDRLRAVQHVREQNTVVIAVGLVAEHGNFEHVRAATGQHFLDRAGAGHAVADHHQTLLLHAFILVRAEPTLQISRRPISTTTMPAVPAGADRKTSSLLSGMRSSTTASET